MVCQVVYLVKVYNIPPTKLVNSDQTCVHPIPTTREKTWESEGPKHIQDLKVENKKTNYNGCIFNSKYFLLPLQIVFVSTIHHCLSPFNEGKDKCMC
jgi:hypothetical protein